MKQYIHNTVDKSLLYNIKNCKKQDCFVILSDNSETVSLVQIMDTVGNANHVVSIVCYWVFASRYKNALLLTRELLNVV